MLSSCNPVVCVSCLKFDSFLISFMILFPLSFAIFFSIIRGEFNSPSSNFGNVHPSDVLDMPVDPNEPTYCLCHQVSYGEMIGCDNTDVSFVLWLSFNLSQRSHELALLMCFSKILLSMESDLMTDI